MLIDPHDKSGKRYTVTNPTLDCPALCSLSSLEIWRVVGQLPDAAARRRFAATLGKDQLIAAAIVGRRMVALAQRRYTARGRP
jgi:hypothetical protein